MDDLAVAFLLADAADAETLSRWQPSGVVSRAKADGTPVTDADIAAEEAALRVLNDHRPGDGFLGEETGAATSTNGRRWIIDGIDGTRSFSAGLPTWGTLIALEQAGEIVLGVSSSPAQGRRWWASRGAGAFTASTADLGSATPLSVSPKRPLRPELVVTLPLHGNLEPDDQPVIEHLAGGPPPDRPWSQQNRVAEGEVDLCIWFAGDIWDHAAPSIIVEEAGGRFSDHQGGKRLDTRTAIYSNGYMHDEALAALAKTR